MPVAFITSLGLGVPPPAREHLGKYCNIKKEKNSSPWGVLIQVMARSSVAER